MMEQVPREEPLGRILDRGPAALTDAELLSVLLRKPRSGTLAAQEKAESLLALFGGVSGLGACDLQIARAQRLGDLQTANLLAAMELARRGKVEKIAAGGGDATAAYLTAHFGRPGQQVLGALLVGHDDEALGIVETFRGTARDVRLDTKTILREALCRDASGIFLFHIFPGTKARIAGEDSNFGRRMLEAAEWVGIELIDYLLIGPKEWISLRVSAADEIAERALSFGASALTEAELVAMLLHRGELGDLALLKARGLIEAIGGVQGLLTCDADVTRAQELNRLQSAALLSAVELGRRLAHVAAASDSLDYVEATVRYIHLLFGRMNQMVVGAIFMDIQNRCVGHLDAFRGVHQSVKVERRLILREALRHNAHGLIVFQSRPNGDPTASEEDVEWAARMRKACQQVDLELHDYLVLAGERWTSIRRSKAW